MRSSIACVGGYGMLGVTALRVATEQYYIFSPARKIKSIDVRRHSLSNQVDNILLVGDITDRSFNEKLFETAGELDVLINNAGSIETRHRIHESDPEEWWGVLEAKTKGTYLPTRKFLRRNLGRPLTILNTSSILSANTIPGYPNRFAEFLHFEYQQQDGAHTFAYHPATQHEKTEFLRGRFVDANWDVDELLAKKGEIVEKGLLWTSVNGQLEEQGLKLGPSLW
ncbi:hypothetical protein M422DRAFT_51938 [Sphaerobolus stellatus SS14]|uniref:Unplaced genomic scaffold SPHSTscaffold_122, whole genome shotgun sequence n=1 Tax=Sphaerobolus stellatus (strain SS14) TaxID=990650 RepID=A0A0C9UZI1_SPHS4|nr:hypothetical protein M422DRAFT_51938 [Sphaerobolus stellatus SS14]